jgi:DNA-binding NarL/FixJ family response regulator
MLQAALAYDRMSRAAPHQDAAALAAAALSDGQLVAADPGLLWVWAQVVLDLADEDVLPMWDTINADGHQRGSLFSVLAVGFWRAWSLMRRGELAEAEQSIRTGIEQLSMWQPDAPTLPYGRATLARILFDQGHHGQARAVIGEARALTAMDGDRLLAEVDAELLLAAGRPEEALARLDEVVTRVPQVINPAWRRDRLLWCLAAAECGEPRAARDEAEKLLGLARQWGAAGAVGEALLVLGRLDGTDGVEVLRNAVDVLAASPRRIVHAEALTSLGTALAARGNASEWATDALHEAHTIALQTGAVRVAEQARAVVAAHRLPQPESVDHHNGRLTSIQQRILQLVDAGAGVQEIGRRLFLTPSTVQHHLDEARRRLAAR